MTKMSKMSKSAVKDTVATFVFTVLSHDGATQDQRFLVSPKKKKIKSLPISPWDPEDHDPASPYESAALAVTYRSGKVLTVELAGNEALHMQTTGLLGKMLEKIALGRSPGDACRRTLNKVYAGETASKSKSKAKV